MSCVSRQSSVTDSYSKAVKSNDEITPVADEEGFDGLLTSLGFGKWQFVILLSPILAMAVYPVHLLGASFLNAPVPFRCSAGNATFCEGATAPCWNNTNSFQPENNSTYYNNACLEDNLFDNPTFQNLANLTLSGNQRLTNMKSCPVIEYDTAVFTSTVVSEFDLVCERTYLRPLFVTLESIGNMVGSIIGGYAGDRWGRLWAVKIGGIVNILVPIAMVLVPYYPLLLVTRFLAGFSLSATIVAAWSMGIECTPCKHRSLVGMFLGLPFSVFLIAYAGMAYLIRSWKYLLLAGASPALLLLPVSFLATESPRWLLQQNRLEEVTKVLQKAESWNGVTIVPSVTYVVEKLSLTQRSFDIAANTGQIEDNMNAILASLMRGLSYLRYPTMRTIFLTMGVIWILHNILYIGVALNTNNFAGDDPFLYVALTGVMDAGAILLMTPLTSCFGRRVFLMTSYVIGGLLFFLELTVPTDVDWLRWVMVMGGFFLVAGSMQVNYLYSPEVFPTEIRARGFAFVQLLGNLGSSVAPFITDVLSQYTWWATGVIFGCAGLIGGALVPFLPETRNKPLPETVQDIEERGKKKKKKKKQHMKNTNFKKEVEEKKNETDLKGIENESFSIDVV